MRRALVIGVLASVAVGARTLRAQVISPGKLAAVHSELEGVRQCTQCHELGERGVSTARCLSCHAPLKTRLDRGAGYHAAVANRSCAHCHKEHLGRDFALVRLDTAAFEHGQTGYRLEGDHVRARCRACHAPRYVAAGDVKAHQGGAYLQKTFLGLPRDCGSCHDADSPHGRQFASRGCDACHDSRDWKSAPRFDHAQARYPLTGEHRVVACARCHVDSGGSGARFVGVRFGSCADCHRDPHAGAMAGTCAGCHATTGWQRVDAPAVARSFDHARTSFPLRGAHARATCAQCHQRQRRSDVHIRFVAGTEAHTFARPVLAGCVSCHVDPHPARFAQVGGRQGCAGCHGERRWLPATYDAERHNGAGRFALTGAHAVVACNACHTRAVGSHSAFGMPLATCASCHAGNDPHKGMFGRQDCGECHDAVSFRGARFDHERASGRECASCHAARDPHVGQFGRRGCEQCHGTETFRIERLDHTRADFQLDGAHARVACALCHRTENAPDGSLLTRYKPLPTSCGGCHGGGS